MENGSTTKNIEAMTKLLEKNSELVKEVKDLKKKWEIQSVTLCEAIKQKKKAMEEKIMDEQEKRKMARRLEERYLKYRSLQIIIWIW